MGDLSKNFSRAEFRCRHCGAEGIQPVLVQALQDLRDQIGRGIVVNSGYRCPAHPVEAAKAQGPGVHSRGIAADIRAPGLSLRALHDAALRIPAFAGGGIGVYPQGNFIHVDTRSGPARWAYLGTRSIPYTKALDLLP
jgi:uncharacterized protein YcbK (DUF882 family)